MMTKIIKIVVLKLRADGYRCRKKNAASLTAF